MKTLLSLSHVRTLLVLGLAASTAAAQSILSQNGEVVLGAGEAVPGLPGVTVQASSNFDNVVVDQSGTMLFRARLSGAVTGADDRAYFLGRGRNDLQVVVRASDQAPGYPAGYLLRSNSAAAGSVGLNGSPRISPRNGYLFFLSNVYDPITPTNTPTTADSAFFWGPPGGLFPLAKEGDPVPFLTGPTWGAFAASLQTTQINTAGSVLFISPLVGATTADDSIMVTGTPGSLEAVIREGETLTTGEVIVPVSGTTLSFGGQLNSVGQVVTDVKFAIAGTVTAANDRGVLVWTPGSPAQKTIIARESQQAPGLPAGVLFKDTVSFSGWSAGIGSAGFNSAGDLLFTTNLEDGGTTVNVDNQAIYLGNTTGLQLVLRRNDPAPGLPAGVNFGVANSSSMTLNDAGTMIFNSSLQGAVTAADDSAMWFGTLGNLVCLAREGDVIPGLTPSVNGPWRYGQISTGTNTGHLNGSGKVLFQNTATDGVGTTNVYLSYDPTLGVRLMLEVTDQFTTTAGSATLTTLGSSGNFNSSAGGSAWFTDDGDFVQRISANAPVGAVIMRGHVGSLQAKPASVPAAGGVTQNLNIDCGTAQANNLYIVVSGGSGTTPGFSFGAAAIPLNPDIWLNLSLDLANSAVYTNSLGLLDGSGKASASFTLPPGVAGLNNVQIHHAVLTLDFFTLAGSFASEPASLLFY